MSLVLGPSRYHFFERKKLLNVDDQFWTSKKFDYLSSGSKKSLFYYSHSMISAFVKSEFLDLADVLMILTFNRFSVLPTLAPTASGPPALLLRATAVVKLLADEEVNNIVF